MYVEIKNLGDWHQTANAGMVKELYLIRMEDVEYIQLPEDNARLNGEIPLNGLSLKVGAELTKMDFAYNRCTFNEPNDDEDNGVFFMPSFSFEIPKVTTAVSLWLSSNKNRRFLCMWRDGNQCCYLTGSKNTGLKLLYSKDVSNENKYVVSLGTESCEPTRMLAGLVLSEMFKPVEFSNEFSFDYNS
jgi:hypothetical protein